MLGSKELADNQSDVDGKISTLLLYDFSQLVIFYNSINQTDWPVCLTQQDFQNLPKHILLKIVFEFKFKDYSTADLLDFYNFVKVGDWPDCDTPEDFQHLSNDVLLEIVLIELTQGSTLKRLSRFPQRKLVENHQYYSDHDQLPIDLKFRTNDIDVYYNTALDGGGTSFGMRMNPVIRKIHSNRKFKHCFEWCAGPAFIGFDLLSSGMCDQLYLADIYGPALEAIDKTVQNMPDKYAGRVHSVKTLGVADLPQDWKFDLVVGSPPHWDPTIPLMITQIAFRDRICADVDWAVHREFFSNIGNHLTDDGVILLQEQTYASGPDMFQHMIDAAGLKIVDCYWEFTRRKIYYIEIVKK
jgi:hypothetical protein